jgi:hypothetical protein
VLKGRQYFAAEISGVGTACLPDIIVEMYSREYNMHCRAIRQGLVSCEFTGYSRGSQFFVVEFSGVGTVSLAHIIADMHSQEYNVYFRAMRQRLASLDPIGA